MEVVYENATKEFKRVTYTLADNKERSQKVAPKGVIKVPKNMKFEIVRTETVE